MILCFLILSLAMATVFVVGFLALLVHELAGMIAGALRFYSADWLAIPVDLS